MITADFKNPPEQFKPIPFWGWNDMLNADELKRQIDEFVEKGYGGHFMHSRVGLVTSYLSEEWMKLIRECVSKSKESHTKAWLYDEDKWPSGYAGGRVPLTDSSYGSRNLLLLRENEITENDTILETCNHDNIDFYICKRVEPHTYKWFNNTCYIDVMNDEAVNEFIRVTHEAYRQEVGDDFGGVIPGVFTDEPAYHMYNLTKNPSLPWSEKLPERFEEKNGYSILEHMESLFFENEGYEKVRYDFFKCAAEMFLNNFTLPYSSWCKKNGMKMTGHYMSEDKIDSQTKFVGYTMPHYIHMDIPGVDKLRRDITLPVSVKQMTTVAEQFGKEQALCEIFGCIGHNSSFFHRKWIADWAMLLGINLINGHLALYSMRGERKRDYPSNLFYQQPWWEDEKEFSDYISRSCYLASLGKRDAKILVIHPLESGWCVFSAYNDKRGLMNGTEIYDKAFEQLTISLLNEKLEFHYGDEEILSQYGRVENGKLIVGNMEYTHVVIPKCLTLRSSTLSLLEEFKGKILCVASKPVLLDGVKTDYEIKGAHSVLTATEAAKWLREDISDSIKITDRISGANATAIWSSKRVDGEAEYYFLVNTSEKREVPVKVCIPGEKEPYLINLKTGNYHELSYEKSDGCILFDAVFYPAGSMALVLREKMDAAPPLGLLETGVTLEHIAFSKELSPIAVNILEDNVLPLQHVTFQINGKIVAENAHISTIWHPHFYGAEEGSPFVAEYTFDVESIPQKPIYAVIEFAENLDEILINGYPIHPLKERFEMGAFNAEKCWKDVHFTKVPLLNNLKQGRNVLTIRGKKVNNIIGVGFHLDVPDSKGYCPTEVETVYLVGDFSVRNLDNTVFQISEKNHQDVICDLTKSGYPFYSGRAEFVFRYVSEDEKDMYFKVNHPSFASSKVYVNDVHCGTINTEPFIFKAHIKKGENLIRLDAASTLYNLMGPNWNVVIPEYFFVGPNQFIDKTNFSEKLSLLPFGMDGLLL